MICVNHRSVSIDRQTPYSADESVLRLVMVYVGPGAATVVRDVLTRYALMREGVSMTDDTNGEIRVELVVDDANAAELDSLTANLRQELLQLDVNDVTRLREGPPPPGAKAVELVALASLVIAVGNIAGALSSVVHTIQGWVGHKPDRKVRLEMDGDVIELSSATTGQQQQLVDEWLTRHGTA